MGRIGLARSTLRPIMTNLVTWLAQLQFFSGLGFLLVFLLIELALAWVLFAFKLATHFSSRSDWLAAYRFWVRVFALASMLVLAGSIPVIFQLGSLWPGLMDRAGGVIGPLVLVMMVVGVIFRSCFLGAMLFGQARLSAWIHTVVVFMTAAGITTTVWLGCLLLGWLSQPTGGDWVDERYVVQSWSALAGNEQAWWLFGLLLGMSALTVACLLLGVVSRQSLQHPAQQGEVTGLRTGLVLGLAGWLVVVGALAGYGTPLSTQVPARAAAVMGYWKGGEPPALVLFAWPDQVAGVNRFAIQIPGGGRWLGQDDQGNLIGLDRYTGMAPPVALVFWAARLLGLALLAMAVMLAVAVWHTAKRGYDLSAIPPRWREWWAKSTYLGCAATLFGLLYLLAGHMPYAVQGKVTLAEVAVPHSLAEVLFGWLLYGLVYGVLIWGFVRMLRHIGQYGVVPVARHRGRA